VSGKTGARQTIEMNIDRLREQIAKIFALFFSVDFCSHSRRRGGGVAACCACQQPTEERCKNFRSVAVILFERG
jgi:hypothetical protein